MSVIDTRHSVADLSPRRREYLQDRYDRDVEQGEFYEPDFALQPLDATNLDEALYDLDEFDWEHQEDYAKPDVDMPAEYSYGVRNAA